MIPRSPKVLVTGASGYIASWTVRTILERGLFVRGTVRSKAKGEYLSELFKEGFEYVIVEDIGKERAFDDAVKGVDYVVHPASPFHWNAEDPQGMSTLTSCTCLELSLNRKADLIKPALLGTLGLLESILKFGPTVKRVVITSSTLAITQVPPPGGSCGTTVCTEKNWNTVSTGLVEKQGVKASQGDKYTASKVIAERAAWEFVDKHRDHIGWDLVTLHPPFTFGPVIHETPSLSSLNNSAAVFLALLKNDPPLSAADLLEPTFYNSGFVDVREVAWAHAEALFNDQIGCKSKRSAFDEGKGRVSLSSGPFTWQDIVDAIDQSSIPLPKTAPLGTPGGGKAVIHPVVLDSNRARNVLGVKFRPMQETVVDMLNDFREKGWIS